MTNTTAPSRTIPGLVADPRPLFARSVELAASVIDGIDPDRLHGPTPCDQFDVRTLAAHLVEVVQRVTALGEGRNPMALPGVPERLDLAGLRAEFAIHGAAALAAFASDDRLDQLFTLPWATAPGRVHLATYTNELTVHSWDLAVATRQSPAWDPEVVALADSAIRAAFPPQRSAMFDQFMADLPPEMRAAGRPWRDAVDAGADADGGAAGRAPIDLLVAYNGRDPRWEPGA